MESYFNFISGLSHDVVGMAVNGLLLGIALTGIVWVLWRFAKRINAATSYCIWWTVLAVVVAMPLAMGGATRAWFESGNRSEKAQSVNITSETEVSEPIALGSSSEDRSEKKPTLHVATNRHKTGTASLYRPSDSRSMTPATSSTNNEEAPSMSSLMLGLMPVSLFGIWLAVVFVLLTRILLAYRRIYLIKRRSRQFDIGGFPRIVRLIDLSASRPVQVRLSSEIEFPMAAGLGSPTIIIPRRLAFQLTPGEMESVIMHELAHLERWDDWSKLGQRIAEALMFFNPAVCWIGRRLDLDREIACDDRVIEEMGRPDDYARCLTRLTQLTSVSGASLIPGVLTSRKQIFKRFEKLLDKDRRRGTHFSRGRFALAIIPVVAAMVLAVNIMPAVALPVEEVLFDEFYSTVKAVAGRAVPAGEVEPEPELDEGPILAAVVPSESPVPDAGVLTDVPVIDLAELRSDLLVIEDRLAEMEDLLVAVPEVAEPVYAAWNDGEESRSTSGSGSSVRVIDWDDDMFDMKISGNVHGIDGIDDWVEIWTGDDKDVKVVCKGDVRFSRDHRSVKSISDDGFMAIRDKQGSSQRELDVESTDRGKLEYDYYVDGKLVEFDDEAEEWLAEILEEAVPEILEIRKEPSGASLRGVSRVPRDDTGLLETFVDWTGDAIAGFAGGMYSITHDSGEHEVHWSEGRRDVHVTLKGEVEFTDDEKDIKSISEGGYFSILDRDGRKRHELEVEPDEDGNLEYKYWVNDKSQEFDDDARDDWLADILYDIITRTGLGAEARAERIYKEHGIDGVLDEISSIESDYVKRIYFQAVLDVDDLSQDDYGKVLRMVSRYVDSDYEKAELLVQMTDDVVENKGLTADYVDAVADLDSDYETRRVLSALSLRDPVDEHVVLAVLDIAWEMDSDYEKAELLIDMAPYCEGNEKLQAAYVDAAVDLDSDYETRRVLSDLILDERTDDSTVIAVLDIISRMDSDYERAELLIDVSDYRRNSHDVARAYYEAIRGLDSDYEKRRVLSRMYDDDTDEESLIYVLDLADEMDSDYDKAELLIDMADRSSAYEKASEAYLVAAANIGSSYETKRVLLELIDRRDLNDDLVLAVLSTTESMNSDYEKSEVLKELARYCRGKDLLEDAYIDAVETLDSDYEIDRLYSKLYRRSHRSTGEGN